MKIFKYDIEMGTFSIKMHTPGRFISAQMQNNKPMMWVLVDEANKKVWRDYMVVGTGFEFSTHGMEFLATYQQGPFVWHLFERVYA